MIQILDLFITAAIKSRFEMSDHLVMLCPSDELLTNNTAASGVYKAF